MRTAFKHLERSSQAAGPDVRRVVACSVTSCCGRLRRQATVTTLALLLAAARPAVAARPLVTDDARVTSPGACQLETWTKVGDATAPGEDGVPVLGGNKAAPDRLGTPAATIRNLRDRG